MFMELIYQPGMNLLQIGLVLKEIKEFLGIDGLIYQTPSDLIKSIQEVNPDLKNFDMSVFNGVYIN